MESIENPDERPAPSRHDRASRGPAAFHRPAPVALVTGAARRLGRHLALALGTDGYDVAVAHWKSADEATRLVTELEALGIRAAAFRADLRRADEARSLVDAVESELGEVSLLVNNAGVLLDADVQRATVEDLDESLALNLRAPYILSLRCGRRMRARGFGSIVNIASVGGLRPYLHHIPYSVSKAGLIMLTQTLALALAPEVNVNAVAPGSVRLGVVPDLEESLPPRKTIPLGDYARPADVVHALRYLLGAPSVTGQILTVDGGASLGGRRG